MHQTFQIPLPETSPGTIRFLTAHRWGSPGARPKVYIHGGLHADELPATLTACQLIPLLDAAQEAGEIKGEVIVVPAANPIGLSQTLNMQRLGRFAFADGGGNFNRNWPDLATRVIDGLRGRLDDDPAHNIATTRAALVAAVADLPDLSEKEAHQKALLSLSIDADVVMDMHCDARALLHLYANAEHAEQAAELGRFMGAGAVLLEQKVTGGLFDECNAGVWIRLRSALGLSPDQLPAACFAPILELRGQADVSPELAAQDAAAIMAFLRHRGLIAGKAPPLPAAQCDPTPGEGCSLVRAPRAGLVLWRVPVGATVASGDHLADVLDLSGANPLSDTTAVHARQTGLLYSQSIGHMFRPGDILGQIAGKEPVSQKDAAQFP